RCDSGESPAVERPEHGNDAVASAGSSFIAELSREFVERFIRLRAAVAKEDFSARSTRRAGKPDEAFGELTLRPCEIKIGGVHQRGDLLLHRGHDMRMAVADGGHRNAGAEIEIAFARFIPNLAALAARQTQLKPAIGRDDEAVVKL